MDGIGTNAHFQGIDQLAIDSLGNLYVTERASFTLTSDKFSGVRMLSSPNYNVTTLIGYMNNTVGISDGTYNTAKPGVLVGIAVSDTAIYVADFGNHYIRKLDCGGYFLLFIYFSLLSLVL